MRGAVLDEQLNYWKEKLADAPALELPLDRPRPPIQTLRGAAPRQTIPPHLYDALKALSRREGTSLFMTMLAAFQTLLYRYSGQEDIVIGSGVAGRRLREMEG